MSLFNRDLLNKDKRQSVVSDLFQTSLLDNQTDIFLLFDKSGRLMEANQAFTTTLGYSIHELKQLTYESLLPEDQIEKAWIYYHKLMLGEPQTYDLCFLHQTGRIIELSVAAVPRRNNDIIDGFYAIVRDLSEIKLNEQRYISILKNMLSATFTIDLRGTILDLNDAAVTLTGYEKHEQVHFSQLIKPEDLDRAMEYNQRVSSGESLSFSITILHKNGRSIDVITTLFPIFMRSKVTGIIAISNDISDEKRNKQLLQVNTQRYKSLFEQNPDAVSYFDRNGTFIDCNPALEKRLGYSADELLYSGYKHLIAEQDLIKADYYFNQTLKGESQSYELVCRHKLGHDVYMSITKLPIIIDHEIIGVYSIAKDITTKKNAENAVIEAESKYRSLVEQSIVGVYIIQNNIIVYANPYLVDMLGYEDAIIGMKIWDLICPEDFQFVKQNIQKLENESDVLHHPLRVVKANGGIIDVEMYSNRIIYQGTPAVIGTILDVTERKRAEQMNAFLAYHDSLTELPNRRMFEERLKQALEESSSAGQPFALIYLDMDRFKYINDSLGHAVGDQLLISIAKRLQEQIRETDLVARMGGDEFTVILPRIRELNCAIEVAKRIIEKFQEPFKIEQYELFITTSAGISIFPNDGEDASTLMKNADSALYRAKELGKNNYQIYTASLNIQTYKLFTLEKDLRKAIQHNELEMYYQPKVNIHSGEIVGAEALIRWNHPEWGLVSPDEFLPISEETGLIIPLGQWVKQTVCRQNKKWQQSGHKPIPVSINVSAKEFLSRDIIPNIQQALSDSELDPQYLEIEITEGSLLENADSVMVTLDALSKLGIKISLDDFGTGYSSLSYLKRFKRTINVLKIDKSFIQDLHLDNDDNVIIQTIIQLAQHMNMSVVAEGVETGEQLRILKRLKCDMVQGYLFSKPIRAEQFSSLLEQGALVPYMNKNDQEQSPYENKRSYFRVNLHFPLLASMTVIKINEKNIELGKTDVIIENIGVGGMMFLSSIKLSVHPGILLEIETQILNKTIQMYGTIVRLIETEPGIYQYGLDFQMSENDRSSLNGLLNDLSIQLRKHKLIPGCSFIKADRYHYLRKLIGGQPSP